MLNVYNVYDEAQEEFVLQFLFVNDKVCKRSLSSMFENKSFSRQVPDIEKYPNTFRVFKTATFDEKSGLYTPLEIKEELFSFIEFVKDEDKNL